MKRILLLSVLALAAFSLSLVGSCSHPLESDDIDGGQEPSPNVVRVDTLWIIDTVMTIDTVAIYDSVFNYDTLVIRDSNFTFDTVYYIDSVIQIDTVVISNPGTGGPLFVCATLSTGEKKIIWMFRNSPGRFLLEFAATAERIDPSQTVIVTIGGQEYEWKPATNNELIVEQDLEENATIQITPNKPSSYGHSVSICLTMTRM